MNKQYYSALSSSQKAPFLSQQFNCRMVVMCEFAKVNLLNKHIVVHWKCIQKHLEMCE